MLRRTVPALRTHTEKRLYILGISLGKTDHERVRHGNANIEAPGLLPRRDRIADC